MLRITQTANAAAAKRYYSKADYYSEGQEIIGLWGGDAAKTLGLEGVVNKELFDRLCDNLKPLEQGQLTVRTRSERTVGYDFTWSVPKSVSLIYGMTGDTEILDAFRSAVHETMCDIEKEMKTRVRKGKLDLDRTTGNMAWAEFIHTTSRPVNGVPDPQLHAHCFVFNSTWDDQEQRWKAGQFRDLKRDAPYFQAAFRVRLAEKLQAQGYGITRKRDDFEVTGLSAPLLRKFSRRTAEIEKEAERLGITDAKRKAALGAETREAKSDALSWNQIRKLWDEKLTVAERQSIASVHRRESDPAKLTLTPEEALDFAIGHVFARKSVASERELLTAALSRGIGAVNADELTERLKQLPLIRHNDNGRVMVTTQEVVSEEKFVINTAKAGRGRFRPLGDKDRKLTREWLNDGQKNAVRHVLSSRDRVTLIRGAAGTGKTKMMLETVEGIEAAGKHVTVLAPTVAASHEVLRAEGFSQAQTVARFLTDARFQEEARGQVIWVDESGMLGMKDMARLFEAAKELDARIVLSGDRRQHRSVARGEPLKLLEEQAGLPVAEISEIMRQENADYRKAVQSLSKGEIEAGLIILDRMKSVREVSDASRNDRLVSEYLAAVKLKKKDGSDATGLIVSPTHAEADRITGAIRETLAKEGKLNRERQFATWTVSGLTEAEKTDGSNFEPGDMLQWHTHAPGHKSGTRTILNEETVLPLDHAERFEHYRPSELAIAVGDRVRVTRGGKTRDGKHILATNALFTVKGFNRRGDIVVDHDWVIDRDFGHLDHGYVVTSHASQGKTVDRVFIGQSSASFPASNARQFYVSVSRGRAEAVVFTDDRKALLKAVKRPDETVSAVELERQSKLSQRKRRRNLLARSRRTDTVERSRDQQPQQGHDVSQTREAVNAR